MVKKLKKKSAGSEPMRIPMICGKDNLPKLEKAIIKQKIKG